MSESIESGESAFGPLLCEVAWEVCQQVGGIYTVLRSKVPTAQDHWSPRYVLVGPYDPANSAIELGEAPAVGILAEVIDELRKEGLDIRTGRWLVSGQPRVVLMDYRSAMPRLAEIKYRLWKHHDIALPDSDPLLDPVVAFAHMVERFFEKLTRSPLLDGPVIGHFHEWMGGVAIPELRRHGLPLSIVFTTHATTLGRYLAPNDPWFYDHLPFVDWLADARRFRIEPQVRLERAAAHGAHVFTTVSDVTAEECASLIGRRPDVVTPNGLNIERFVAMHEFQNLHREYRRRIDQFVMGHFFASYSFDLENTLYYFTSGRYEYRNKGFDLTIEALARLNHRLRQSGLDRTIVFFLASRRPFRGINAEALQSRAQMEEIRNTVEALRNQLGDRLFNATAMGQSPSLDELVDDYWKLRLRRMRHAWRISRLPVIVTHDLLDDATDEVLGQLRSCGLINRPEDRVKVIYYADFLSAATPLIGLDYDQFVRGCHLGIFPSFYEPWGYTPQECVARGIPAITSDLTGFGAYVQANIPDHDERGLFVVRRRQRPFEASAGELADRLWQFAQFDRRGRIALRNRVEGSADQFDWSNLYWRYLEAYTLAMKLSAADSGTRRRDGREKRRSSRPQR